MKNIFKKNAVLTAMLSVLCFAASAQITLQLAPSDYNGYNVSCFGLRDGSINLTVTGGTPPYTYIWSNEATTEDITGLAAGFYEVRVTDANDVSETGQITLTEPLAFGLRLDPSEYVLNGRTFNISCAICYDGSITSTLTEGISPFTYLWDDNTTTQNRSGLYEGTYKLVVTDDNGCTVDEVVYLDAPERTDWTMTGNIGSNPSTNFIGTSDNVDFVFRTNNAERMRIKGDGTLNFSNLSGSGDKIWITDNNGNLVPRIIYTPVPIPTCTDPLTLAWQFKAGIPNVTPDKIYTCWDLVGIGTDDPKISLHVKGEGIRISHHQNTDSYLQFKNDNANSNIWNSGNGHLLINYDTWNNSDIVPQAKKDVAICTGESGNVELGGNNYLASGGGYVGIGTPPTSNYKLDVAGAINATDIRVNGETINLWQKVTVGNDIYYNNGGKIGIGNSNPYHTLDVTGDINATGDIKIDGNSITGGLWQTITGGGIYYNGGNVGIGTANPDAMFQVGNGTNRITISPTFQTATSGGDLDWPTAFIGLNTHRVLNGSSYEWISNSDGSHNGGASIWGTINGDIYFSTIPSEPAPVTSPHAPVTDIDLKLNTKMKIKHDGKVGIGNTNPGYTLDVTGDINATGDIKVAGVSISAAQWQLHANGTDIYRNTGNVGIGVSNPTEKFQVNSGNALIKGTDNFNAAGNEASLFLGSINYSLKSVREERISLATPSSSLTLTNGGSVGIGTNEPAQSLAFPVTYGTNTTPPTVLHLEAATPILRLTDGSNNGDDFQIVPTGNLTRIMSTGGISLFLDADDDDSYESFKIYQNSNDPASPTEIFKVNQDGRAFAKSFKVANDWSDYVFDDGYKLKSLKEVEVFIKEHKHLEGIPPGHEIETDGLDVGLLLQKHMEKIEELTLYAIGQEKTIEALQKENAVIKEQLAKIVSALNK